MTDDEFAVGDSVIIPAQLGWIQIPEERGTVVSFDGNRNQLVVVAVAERYVSVSCLELCHPISTPWPRCSHSACGRPLRTNVFQALHRKMHALNWVRETPTLRDFYSGGFLKGGFRVPVNELTRSIFLGPLIFPWVHDWVYFFNGLPLPLGERQEFLTRVLQRDFQAFRDAALIAPAPEAFARLLELWERPPAFGQEPKLGVWDGLSG